MIDWYSTLVGAEVIFQDEMGAWLSNDEANHRIALLAFPNFADDPEKDTTPGCTTGRSSTNRSRT